MNLPQQAGPGDWKQSRRDLLRRSIAIGVCGLGDGCSTTRNSPSPLKTAPIGREYLGTLEIQNPSPIVDHVVPSLEGNKSGVGRNARKFTNFSDSLPEGPVSIDRINSLVTSTDNHFIRTETPDLLDPDKLTHLKVDGEVRSPRRIPVKEIFEREHDIGVTFMECAGNDPFSGFRLISAAHWSGVYCEELFPRVSLKGQATHLLISGFDERRKNEWPGVFAVKSKPGASWIFSFDELKRQGAFFATKMNRERLSHDHGYPVRLVVPGWYGCASIKWVNHLTFLRVDQDTLPTSQMKEFANRTHQDGVPSRYLTYQPPAVDLAAVPIRVEKWRISERAFTYKIVGLMWGGIELKHPDLRITIRDETSRKVVVDCAKVTSGLRKNRRALQLWSFWWKPDTPGRHTIDLSLCDSRAVTRRLDRGYYRQVISV